MVAFEGVEVFSATMARQREEIGAVITKWMRENKDKEIFSTEIRQSSDPAYHCLTFVLFYKARGTRLIVR